MFIVLEGADGTGKSTLATMFADRIGGVAYATPPKKYRKYSEKLHKDASADQHYKFYRDAVLDASEEIRILVAEGKSVICDRYWLSTLTYHEVMGAKVHCDDFESVLKPSLTILLVSNPDIQIRRILDRGMDSGDKRMLDKQLELTMRFFHNLIATETRFVSIDTGSFSIEESIAFMSNAVK